LASGYKRPADTLPARPWKLSRGMRDGVAGGVGLCEPHLAPKIMVNLLSINSAEISL